MIGKTWGRTWVFGLALALPLALAGVQDSRAQLRATGAPITGEIERITVDNMTDHWSGGTIQVGGQVVIIPRNLLIDLPANRLTLQQLFTAEAGTPAACVAASETGLAKGDSCNTTGTGGFVAISANTTNPNNAAAVPYPGNVIAGDVFIQKGIEVVVGQVTYINYNEGYFRVSGELNDPVSGVMVRLNDPDGRHTVQVGQGCAGGPNCSPDPRFTLDPDNYTNVFSSGYPVCLPSTVQRTFPGLPGITGVPAIAAGPTLSDANGAGDLLCPQENRAATGIAADSRRFAPLKVGDSITVEGNFEVVNGVRFLSVHTTMVMTGIATRNTTDQPDYMFLDEVEIDMPAWQNERIRTLIIGYTTVAPADVLIWSIHYDPVTNSPHEFPLASAQGCDNASGGGGGNCVGTGLAANGMDIFKIRHDVDFRTGADGKLNPCAHLASDPGNRMGTGFCPNGGATNDATPAVLADQMGILSPIPHEIQARTGKLVANIQAGGTMGTLDVNGNAATWGQYLFPFGINLGGIATVEPNEFNLNALSMPVYFSALPWTMDRRLSPAGCIDTSGDGIPDCEATPQPLTPFPFENEDPRTQAQVPSVSNYNDPHFTSGTLSDSRDRMFSFVNPNLSHLGIPSIPETTSGHFGGNSTLLPWVQAALNPPLLPVELTVPVTPCAATPPPAGPPTINSTPVITAAVGVDYVYDVNAVDAPGDVVTFSLDAFPSGMSINPTTGAIAWLPAAEGPAGVTVRATDQAALSSTQSFTITVGALPANTPPQITSTAGATGTEAQLYSYQVVATDTPGDTLSFSLTAAPQGMAISAGGLITWTPTALQVGANGVTVQVTDQGNLFAVQSFTVTVAAAPVAPPVAPTLTVTTTQNTTTVIDPGPALAAVRLQAFAGTVIIKGGPVAGTATVGAGVITYSPNPGFTGTDIFTYTVTGPGGESNLGMVTINVTAALPTESLAITSVRFTPNRAGTAGRWDIQGTSSVRRPNQVTAHLGTVTGPVIGTANVAASGTWRIRSNNSRLLGNPGSQVTVQAVGGVSTTTTLP
ncbi:MAG: putative Ig domain-containing protein [Syntrophobacteraceae bacterium]